MIMTLETLKIKMRIDMFLYRSFHKKVKEYKNTVPTDIHNRIAPFNNLQITSSFNTN
ncbi:hypothetical protein BCD93_000009 [Clostridium saccharoperbutylacetonicum]|nr:hypothetical protein [Clostridium saccharoperbutylacetonicum]